MEIAGALRESIKQVAYAICKDGFGEAIPFNAAKVGHSAAYNRVATAAKGVINNMKEEEAKAMRTLLSEGGDIGGKLDSTILQMMQGDDASRKTAEEFNKVLGGYNTAKSIADGDASKAVSAYAEFLGSKNGKLSFGNAVSGYFGDKQFGNTRTKVALGAAAGVGVAGRLLSGGSLTRTNTGERDIAGVPFV